MQCIIHCRGRAPARGFLINFCRRRFMKPLHTMTRPLEHFTIAILEHRFTREFSALLERFGASVYACPLLEERPVENREELEKFVRETAAGNLDLMVFLTGVGARFLVSAAD